MPNAPLFPMPIETPRLLIRPPQLGDEIALNKAVMESHDNLKKFMSWAERPQSMEESAEYIRLSVDNWILKKLEEPWLPLLIFDKNSLELIGNTGFHHMNWDIPSAEIGYWIRTSQSGKGLMTEAINALTRYAFQQLGLKRISMTCDILNIPSKRVPERLGYSLEGQLKFHRRTPDTGELSDTLIYSRYGLDSLPELEVSWPSQ